MMIAAESKSEGSFKLVMKGYSGEMTLPFIESLFPGTQLVLPWLPSITPFSSPPPDKGLANGFFHVRSGIFEP
jgi:hypothetical protein